MVLYNKRNMGFLHDEMMEGRYAYLKDTLNFLKKAEEENDEWALNMAQHHLDHIIPKLAKDDDKGWRRELLLNYFLNVELQVYKEKDDKYTKWTVFIEKVKEHKWEKIENFVDEIDVYMSSQSEPNNVKNNLTEDTMADFNKKYQTKILPYIHKNLGPIDAFRAELRLTQRLNLIKRKVPINNKVNFGQWVKEKRTALKWSLNTLAEKSGYSPAYIYRIEKGTRKNPTPQVMSKVVEALGYKPEEILNLLFEADGEKEQVKTLKKVELSDIIQLEPFTVNGKEVSEKQRTLLNEIFNLINEDDVLLVPKVNELKEKIKEYQEER